MLVGFTGRARSGKNTAANVLERMAIKRGLTVEQFAFADPLKAMIGELGLFSMNELDCIKEQIIPSIGVSPRFLMQTLGTEWGRDIVHPNLWVILMKNKLLNSTADLKIVTDVRFENEARLIRSLCGGIVRVVRCHDNKVAEHKSEDSIDDRFVRYTLYNNSTLEDFISQVEHFSKGLPQKT